MTTTRLEEVLYRWGLGLLAFLLLAVGSDISLAESDKAGSDLTPAERQKLEKVGAQLNQEAVQLYQEGKLGEALKCWDRFLAVEQKLYPDDPDRAATILRNLAALLETAGEHSEALSYRERALAVYQKLFPESKYPKGHPDLATGLNDLGLVLKRMGEYDKALPYYERGLEMNQMLYPDGHSHLAISLNNLGMLHYSMGEYGKALSYHQRALDMKQKLYPESKYPDGDPDLATSLNNLGMLLESMKEYDKAQLCFERALAMYRKLYPDGDPNYASTLNNLGLLHYSREDYGKAKSYFEQAFAMRQKLYPEAKYPDGHPYLATDRNNLGVLMMRMGEYDKALPHLDRALAMYQKFYPEAKYPHGHPSLIHSLNNLGGLLEAMGEYGKALPYHQRSLAIYRRYTAREIASAPEAQALTLIHSMPRNRHGYLSTALHLPQTGATSYQHVWADKAALMRLQQRRHETALIAAKRSEDARTKYDRLTQVRRHINRLLVDPGKDLKARDQRLAELTEEQEKLERMLTLLLPDISRHKELAKLSPKDLADHLPADTAFVDCIAYLHHEKGKATGFRYLAFVLAPGQEVKRIDLKEAGPIDEAIASWLRAIKHPEDGLSRAPEVLRALVWDKIAQELPAGTRTVFLSPDGDLNRLPFTALPGAKPGTVLLEEYLIAFVPHGPWLLEQLLYPPKFPEGPGRLVAVGGVRYDPAGIVRGKPYIDLPASLQELRQVKRLFPGPAPVDLSGAEAMTAEVRKRLAEARYAHLATHGYFDEEALTEERRRIHELMKTWDLQTVQGWERIGLGGRHPLGYVGLALAGANDPKKAGDDGGILTGLGIVDLPLEGLRLCVLSACETGLGQLTDGEGVIGLQRAFHVAGCPNVVGSLWKVNDAATAALMTQFYRELWEKQRPPLEALREAQLTIYRHPERIPALAGDRGHPAQEKAAQLGSAQPTLPGPQARRADTKLWAAFVLSGVGR